VGVSWAGYPIWFIEETFKQWTQGLEKLPARIIIYSRIRDIPYAVIPDLNSTEKVWR
jgi:hypothetical protein